MSILSSRQAIRHHRQAAPDRAHGNCRDRALRLTGRAGKLFFLLLLIIIGASGASAIPLAEYRARIHQAVAEIESAPDVGKRETPQETADRLAKIFNSVLQLVPLNQTIEWNGEKVAINNSWLEVESKIFQQLPRTDPRVPEILARVWERLRALDDRLTELEAQSATTAADDQGQAKARLDEILRRAEYNPKPPEKNLFQRIWETIVRWWNSLFGGGGSLGSGRSSWFSFIAMIMVFTLAVSLLAFAVRKLIVVFQTRKRKPRREKGEARIVLGERLEADQKASDLLGEADALARRGELRAAIRKAYIALLCELGDRKVLTLAQHKTNRDYLRAVRERRPLLAEMQKLTNSFENHWYGARPTTDEDWTLFRSGYQQTLKTVTGDN